MSPVNRSCRPAVEGGMGVFLVEEVIPALPEDGPVRIVQPVAPGPGSGRPVDTDRTQVSDGSRLLSPRLLWSFFTSPVDRNCSWTSAGKSGPHCNVVEKSASTPAGVPATSRPGSPVCELDEMNYRLPRQRQRLRRQRRSGRSVLVEPVRPEPLEGVLGRALHGQVGQDLAHESREFEPVPRESCGDQHISHCRDVRR